MEGKGFKCVLLRHARTSAASSEEMADAWHEAGAANGGTPIEDPPGMREGGGLKLYLAYLRDPAGNKVCAMYRPG